MTFQHSTYFKLVGNEELIQKSTEIYEKIPSDFNGLWIGSSEIAMTGPKHKLTLRNS